MSSLNRATIIGNVGKNPEIRTTKDGKKIANFSVATSDTWKDKNTGEKREATEWHRVVVFNEGLAGIVEKYVEQGTKVYVEGEIKTRKWTDDSGQEKYSTEIVLSAFKGNIILLSLSDENKKQKSKAKKTTQDNSWQAPSDLDDDIPF